jgi:hypothetical protein
VLGECERLLTKLHDAGCRPVGPVFRIDADGRVSVGAVRHVRIVKSVSPRARRRDAGWFTLSPRGRRG